MQKKSITLGVFLLFISILPNITSSNVNQDIDIEEKVISESGQRMFGMIFILYNNSTSEGLTGYNYRGDLHNVEASFLVILSLL